MPCVVDLATMREAVADLGGDPATDQPARPGRAGHRPLGHHRRLRPRRRLRAQRRDRVPAQPRALPVPALGPDRVRRLQGRPAGHRHRAPGQHRAPRPHRHGPRDRRRARRLPRHLRRHRLAHDDGQRPRRARLGRRRHRGRGRDARPARLDAHPARRRLQAQRRHPDRRHGDRRRPDDHRDAAQARRRRQVRRVLRRGRLAGAARQPRHDRQHEPRVRLDVRDLPDRRGHARVPAPHRPLRRERRARRGLRQGAGHVAQGRSRPARVPLQRVPRARPVDRRPLDRRPEASAGPHRARATPRTPSARSCRPTSRTTRATPGAAVVVPGQRPEPAGRVGRHQRWRPPADRAASAAVRPRRSRSPTPTGREFEIDHGIVSIALDHELHQHVQPVGHDGRGDARQERRREGPHGRPVGQDVDGPGLQGRHRLLREGRHVALPREARLPPRRLRLHDVHRQLRAAQRGDQRRRSTRPTSPSPRCCRATATSRVASTPT